VKLETGSFDVLEDLRVRHQAVVDLIYFTDTQATTLLQLYVTVGLAIATAGVTSIAGAAPLPIAAGWGLVCATAPLLLGCHFCLVATGARTHNLNLPGRGADFWTWAAHEAVEDSDVIAAYLANLQVKQAANNEVNAKTAAALKRAKTAGAAAPIVFLVSAGLALAVVNAVSA
jgi:hypothetical protein